MLRVLLWSPLPLKVVSTAVGRLDHLRRLSELQQHCGPKNQRRRALVDKGVCLRAWTKLSQHKGGRVWQVVLRTTSPDLKPQQKKSFQMTMATGVASLLVFPEGIFVTVITLAASFLKANFQTTMTICVASIL